MQLVCQQSFAFFPPQGPTEGKRPSDKVLSPLFFTGFHGIENQVHHGISRGRGLFANSKVGDRPKLAQATPTPKLKAAGAYRSCSETNMSVLFRTVRLGG